MIKESNSNTFLIANITSNLDQKCDCDAYHVTMNSFKHFSGSKIGPIQVTGYES